MRETRETGPKTGEGALLGVVLVFTGLCCLGPLLLPVLLGAIGTASLTALIGRGDVLLPVALILLAVIAFLWVRRRTGNQDVHPDRRRETGAMPKISEIPGKIEGNHSR